MKTREEAEAERRLSVEKPQKSYIGVSGAIIIVVGALAIWFFATAQPDAAPPAALPSTPGEPVAATIAPALRDSPRCEGVLGVYRRDGVVRGPRRGGMAMVDEARWTALGRDGQTALLSYISCAAYDGRSPDELDGGEMVAVYDAASRKLLVKATRDGIHYAGE